MCVCTNHQALKDRHFFNLGIPGYLMCLLLVLLASSIYGQKGLKQTGKYHFPETPYIRFNLVEGAGDVSLGKINAITQDPNGYMWFADLTKSCITRYDGYRMISFRHDPADPNSLGGTYPEAITSDHAGNIWIGFYGMGLDKYDPNTGIFTHFRHNKNDLSGPGSDSVTTLLVDKEGTLWVGNYGGLDRFDAKTGKFFNYSHQLADPSSLSSNRVRSLYEDRQGSLWVGTGLVWDVGNEGGLNRFNKKTGTFTRYLHDPENPQSLINNKVRAIFEDSKGNFWIGTAGDGLHTMNRSTGSFTRHTYNPGNPQQLSRPPFTKTKTIDHITFITEDITGAIWIGSYEAGINRYDPATGEITHFSNQENEGEFIDNTAWATYISRDGVIWLSTNEGNLYRVDPLRKNIPYVEVGSIVQAIYQEPSGAVWIGTPKGLMQTQIGQHFTRYFTPDSLHQGSKDGYTIKIEEASKSNLWVTFGGRLLNFNLEKKFFTLYKNPSSVGLMLDKTYVATILKDHKGLLWIGGSDGLYRLNPRTCQLTVFNSYTDSIVNQIRNINSILEDDEGDLWIATRFGGTIYRWHRSTGKFELYTAGAIINCMYEDIQGTIWVGTTNGLYQYRPATNVFSVHSVPGYSLNSGDVRNIIEDDNKNIWVSSKSGIFKLSIHHTGIVSLGKNQGLHSNALSYTAYKLKTGELLFGDATGYYAFFPDQLTKNTKSPQIAITDFRISDQIVKPGKGCILELPIERTNKIQLAHNENTFSFDFSGIHYSSPSENSHLFMLEGHENNWRNAGTERSAHYFNLPHGNYVFKVKSVSSDGMWAVKSIQIVIVPAWWNTWWFRITAGVCIALFLYAITRWWLNQKFRLKLERSEKEKQLANLKRKTAELEMQALRAQMNPHFIFNSLNSINRFILQNNKLQASEYLTKFSKLIRLILQNSQAAFIPLESELESLQLYLELESLRFDHHFQFEIKVEDDLDVSSVKVPPLIIQPYAENAIWHGLMHKEEKGRLEIELYQTAGMLCCKITDDGIGRKKAGDMKSKSASTHKSMGMRITADRIANLQQKKQLDTYISITDLILHDGSCGGTEVLLKVPLMQQVTANEKMD
ncbi:MAG: histidine kinase [Chitinophagaceae bacterium]|nr:histidine kinase [Chitinophagaceae bacterium]